ncbi:hypothetical protein F5X98DRAFT_344042 [Xylaria grammica]|nr:hypothetical protein F5X98DRAFT_344042 [Xylaria grammica]
MLSLAIRAAWPVTIIMPALGNCLGVPTFRIFFFYFTARIPPRMIGCLFRFTLQSAYGLIILGSLA